MMFYIPDVPEAKEISSQIEKHGGLVVDQHECCSFQIKPNSAQNVGFNAFYMGSIYSETWITDSIKSGRFLNKDTYFLVENKDPSSLKLNVGKKKRYSIAEGILMYEIMGAQATLLH
jgi:hypothetical protein